MPVSQVYVLQYLVQETSQLRDPMMWEEDDAGTYVAEARGIRLQFYTVPHPGGARLCLELSRGSERIYVQEPCNTAFFGRQYESEDASHLADLMQRLRDLVTLQCRRRQEKAEAERDQIQEAIFRQLVFGKPGGS